MKTLSALFAAAALVVLASPAQASCPKNPKKPATIDGVKVKAGSCGPYMMHAEDTTKGYYECTGAKGQKLKALFNDCTLLNAKAPKKTK